MVKLIFKHSNRCPISAASKYEVKRFLEKHGSVVEYEEIDVINNKPRSMEVADTFGVDHQSPQIFIIDEADKLIWHGSHYEITESKISSFISN